MLYKGLVDAQVKQSVDHTSAAEVMDSQILPILQSLLHEVKKRLSEPDKDWALVDKELTKDRETYLRLISNLRSALMRHQWRGDITSPADASKESLSRDPWLADLSAFLFHAFNAIAHPRKINIQASRNTPKRALQSRQDTARRSSTKSSLAVHSRP